MRPPGKVCRLGNVRSGSNNGTIDDKERSILKDIKEWMDQNSSSIYGTCPWKTFGEGPLAENANPIKDQGSNESINYSARHVRYVQRNDTLFATIMPVFKWFYKNLCEYFNHNDQYLVIR